MFGATPTNKSGTAPDPDCANRAIDRAEPSAPPTAGSEDMPLEEAQRFRALLARIVAGSTDAVQELQQQFGEYIVRVIRNRLPRSLRPKYDSVDFVQDVWLSFFRKTEHNFESPEHLIAYLMRMARNKVVDVTRDRLKSQQHDARREQRLGQSEFGQEAQQLYARDATPSETAIGDELWEKMLADQPPAYRLVLVLLREGRTQVEVAERLGLPRRTVQRILERAYAKVQS
jgi:RNA polymerase sigma-70 factor (ECF subfamily)